eukprot:7377239-Prymnesium_polylepis.4
MGVGDHVVRACAANKGAQFAKVFTLRQEDRRVTCAQGVVVWQLSDLAVRHMKGMLGGFSRQVPSVWVDGLARPARLEVAPLLPYHAR